jgi:ATP phosphoribosyltransferase regulatory subunit
MMLATLEAAGLSGITLDLGHVGIYEAVLLHAGLNEAREATVFDALQRKSVPDLLQALEGVDAGTTALIVALAKLHGDESILDEARALYAEAVPDALLGLDTLQQVARTIHRQQPDLDIYFDLAELRGYHYHTGLVFAAYVPGVGEALANGGRYNDVGAVFGRARPATGFATDLKALMALVSDVSQNGAISLPGVDNEMLLLRVHELREAGEVVIQSFSGEVDPRCDRELVEVEGQWLIRPLQTTGRD